MTSADNYALGRSQKEYARLALQARLFAPMTRRLFEDAGITKGMRVLDLGSGAGDVCMLLAEMVGPEGMVIGLDHDPDAIAHARDRATQAGVRNIEFVDSAFADYIPDDPVDAVVGRLVLMYQPDPGTALASVVRHVHPGGVVAFLEPHFQIPASRSSHIARASACIVETLRRSGGHIDLGPRLHRVFTAAGLPVPEMRLECVLDGTAESPLYEYVVSTLESVLPRAIEYGIATTGDFDLDTLAANMRAEMLTFGYAMSSAPLVSGWSRKSI